MRHPSFPRASKAEPHRYAQGGQSGPAPRPVWPSSQPRWASAALQRVRAPRHVDQAVIVFRSRGGRRTARADSGGYACEHAFVSIKGGDYRWLKQALERGDLPLVKASAAQLPAVDLPTALDIGVLAMEREPHNAERAAVRWLGRWALESREATLEGLLEATVALSALAHEPERSEAVLRRLVK